MKPVPWLHPLTGLSILVAMAPSTLTAQAWLFPKGEGSVSLSYQNIIVHDHSYAQGDTHDIGHIFSDAVTMDVDYSFTSRLAARVSLPYIAAKYSGSHPHHLPIDDGTFHSTFQDFSVDLRYNLVRRPAAITPFFRAVIPSHGYEYFAHSAVGRDVHEYHAGANFGRSLNPIFPKAYLQARYAYVFVERILGVSPNRGDAEFQLGYFLTRRLSLLGTGQWMHTYQGVQIPYGIIHGGLTDEQWPHHDQIGKAGLLDVGGGAAFALNGSLEVYLSLARSVQGQNSHLHAAVVTVGMSRSFGARVERRSTGAVEGAPAPQRALVCTCAKSK
jgi:hypothetical protein